MRPRAGCRGRTATGEAAASGEGPPREDEGAEEGAEGQRRTLFRGKAPAVSAAPHERAEATGAERRKGAASAAEVPRRGMKISSCSHLCPDGA